MSINLAELNEAIAKAIPDREAIIFRDRRVTFSEFAERSRKLANFFIEHGLTVHAERECLENWQSGQDHVALYLHNGNEYPESLMGALKARAVPININYRYVEEELVHVLNDAAVKAIVYHATFAQTVSNILADVPSLKVLIQVEDESGADLLPRAYRYEEVLATTSARQPDVSPSPDDLYIVYTGGSTGRPKGVLWRQSDFLASSLGGVDRQGEQITDMQAFVDVASKARPSASLTTAPYMHGTAQMVSFVAWHRGDRVVLQNNVTQFDPREILQIAQKEQARTLTVIGDALARPLLEELKCNEYDLSSLKIIVNAGAVLSHSVKIELLSILPGLRIIDALGSSESGPQSQNITVAGSAEENESFKPGDRCVVLNSDKSGVLHPGHDGEGWFAARGFVPLGYLNDRKKSEETFPIIAGQRYSIPGDRVRLLANGRMDFLGRDSNTINSGGEKIFVEEVEQAIKSHPAIVDVIVSSRPNERWGNEVVAIVCLKKGYSRSGK